MKLIQCELKSGDTRRVCWLEPKVKTGDVVTLKGEDSEWEVIHIYDELDPPEHGWKAGGLG